MRFTIKVLKILGRHYLIDLVSMLTSCLIPKGPRSGQDFWKRGSPSV